MNMKPAIKPMPTPTTASDVSCATPTRLRSRLRMTTALPMHARAYSALELGVSLLLLAEVVTKIGLVLDRQHMSFCCELGQP